MMVLTYSYVYYLYYDRFDSYNNMISKNMINLCSLNVNGIHGREKPNRVVVEWIKTQKCSIAFLQETHLEENIENEIKNKQISLFIVVTVHPQVGG